MPKGRHKLFLILFPLLFLSVPLAAREVTVSAIDADLEIPLEGAVIRSWDGSEHVCGGDGTAVLSVPDDRQVSIQVTYPGYQTGRMVIPVQGNTFSIGLTLIGAIESRELVIEAKRPGSSEARSGRSVSISGEALERSSRIGLIEDVMNAIKLLPGVGYTGMFNAMPSIRGGDPGDLMAVLDGFYIANPYHWGGGFSIFDPNMVESARLSHGIFSARYGHTISGLLEISSKKAAADHTELELGVSTSAVNLNASIPLSQKGGLMLMGKATYWDPFVWALQELSKTWDNEQLDLINAVTTAPYIRSAAGSFHYRFNTDMEMTVNGFIGTDGVGVDYLNDQSTLWVDYRHRAFFTWDNLQTFFITGLTFNPLPSMVLRASAGAGYEEANADAKINYDHLRVYSVFNGVRGPLKYQLKPENTDMFILATQSSANVQGRVDYDWSPGKGFLFAAGLQELYSQKTMGYGGKGFIDVKSPDPIPSMPPYPVELWGQEYYLQRTFYGEQSKTKNEQYNSSAYLLTEYTSPEKRFGSELGLRVDHQYFRGDGFNLQTMPVLNPRLNVDINIFRDRGIVESLDLTAGTGLFSSMNNALISFDPDGNTGDYTLRPNRSWTSVVGTKIDFSGGWSFNIEGYFKYVYDRIYQLLIMEPGKEAAPVLRSDGSGIVWGFDLMIQKFDSRYWDGWLSYTFTHARYHDPKRASMDFSSIEDTSEWYYPYFHRFHSVNLVLNFKPSKNFNIYTRLGLASGQPMPAVGKITEYPVVLVDENKNPVMDPDNPEKPLIITKYNRDSEYSDSSRTTWSVPWDMKFSYMIFSPRTKVQTELYLAVENLFSLFYVARANTSFNQYTGQEDTGSDAATYEMPVPMVSIGVKWSF